MLCSMPRAGRGNVSVRIAGPAPEVMVTYMYDSLAALEQALAEQQAARPEGPLPAAGLLAVAPAVDLLEVLLPLPAGPEARVVTQQVIEFAPGKGPELRRLMEEIVGKRNAAGSRVGIATRVSGGEPAHLLTGLHADLASLEKARAAALSDPEAPARAQRVAALLAHPAELPQIRQIVARFG